MSSLWVTKLGRSQDSRTRRSVPGRKGGLSKFREQSRELETKCHDENFFVSTYVCQHFIRKTKIKWILNWNLMQPLNWMQKPLLSYQGLILTSVVAHPATWDGTGVCTLQIFCLSFFKVPSDCAKPLDKPLHIKYLDPTFAHFSFHLKSNLNCAL